MTLTNKINYNKESSKKYGWSPSLFGATDFDTTLISKVENFQR
jgi:hypothetical protein